jgi:hypothetical protein
MQVLKSIKPVLGMDKALFIQLYTHLSESAPYSRHKQRCNPRASTTAPRHHGPCYAANIDVERVPFIPRYTNGTAAVFMLHCSRLFTIYYVHYYTG